MSEPSAPAPGPSRSPDGGASRRQVLYVEDNAVNALIVTELVARRGDVSVVVAENGSDGIEQARQLRPALVLLDMQLPDMPGLEVFRRLQADPATRALSCVALSANALQSDIDAALEAGVSAYLTKPLDFAAFARVLERFLGPPPAR